jgi:hypothetical protein
LSLQIFVNIVKYKLDLMQKKMETSERDATNRSSFKCTGCQKNFTDLEADQLLDMYTGELKWESFHRAGMEKRHLKK